MNDKPESHLSVALRVVLELEKAKKRIANLKARESLTLQLAEQAQARGKQLGAALEEAAQDVVRLEAELAIANGNVETVRVRLLDSVDAAEKAEARESRLRAALEAILREPYGCPFCNSGKLRNPLKTHTDDCGYALAQAALTEKEKPQQ